MTNRFACTLIWKQHSTSAGAILKWNMMHRLATEETCTVQPFVEGICSTKCCYSNISNMQSVLGSSFQPFLKALSPIGPNKNPRIEFEIFELPDLDISWFLRSDCIGLRTLGSNISPNILLVRVWGLDKNQTNKFKIWRPPGFRVLVIISKLQFICLGCRGKTFPNTKLSRYLRFWSLLWTYGPNLIFLGLLAPENHLMSRD